LKNVFVEIYVNDLVWKVFVALKAFKPEDKERFYVRTWVNELKKHPVCNACVVTAAVNWKSSVQMKLMGI